MHKVLGTYKVTVQGKEYIFEQIETEEYAVKVYMREGGIFGYGMSLERAIEDAFLEYMGSV